MLHTKLDTIVKAVRLRYAVLFALLLAAIYWMGIHPWMTNWGSTAAEQQMVLPGDDLNPDGSMYSTKAITINAPPDVIWQWLAQVGQDRAGFYTYTWLENLVGADIHNENEIHPEWQQLAVGDGWRLAPPGYMGQDMLDPILLIEPGHVIALNMFGAHVIVPVDEKTSRLLVRGRSGSSNLLSAMLVDPLVFTLERRMLLGLKARAEGRPDGTPALMAIAHLGWIAAGIVVAGLFLSQRRRRYWIVLPVVAMLPALVMAGDVQAALAAFLAVGITVLGFLLFGRDWWGPLLVIASLVLLTLLLAPEAYIAFGLAFVLLLLAAVGVMIAERSGARGAAARGLAESTR
jgi:hypothetical protein